MAVQDDVLAWRANEPRVYRPGFVEVDSEPPRSPYHRLYTQPGDLKPRAPATPPPAGVFTARTEAECWQLAYASFRRSYPSHTLDDFKAAMIFIGPAPQVVDGRYVIDLEVSP